MSAMRRTRLGLSAALCAALAVAGCSLAPVRLAAVRYDFGPLTLAATAPRLSQPIVVADVAAPPWLDTSAMLYRLAYRDAAQPRAYADSRWAAPPAALLTAQLRARLTSADPAGVLTPGDGVSAPLVLRVELQEFTQVFETPAKSVAQLALRATLLHDGRLIAQRVFVERMLAATPNAAGGAAAFASASERVASQIIGWLAANPHA